MVSSVYWEWELFLLSMKIGLQIALIYEAVVIFRIFVKHRKWMIMIEDLCYWIYATAVLFKLQYRYSNGVLRGFSILGVLLGMVLYYIVVGKSINKLVKDGRRKYGAKKNSGKKKETE